MGQKNKKRIAIDARFYGPKNKGLGRYTQEIVDQVTAMDQESDYVVFLRQENYNDYQAPGPHVKKVLADVRWYTLAEQLIFPWLVWREKPDLMHFMHFNVPLLMPVKFIVTIHDLILARHHTTRASTLSPLFYRLKHLAYRLTIWAAIKRARKIIAVSEFTKNDIIKKYHAHPPKIKVIYEGLSPRLISAPADINNDKNIILGYNIHRPYLLYVGNAYPHKNLENLIDIFTDIKEKYPDFQLVLVGKEDYFYKRLKKYSQASPNGGDIVFAGFVPDKHLAAIYRQASAYIFPSLYEGFGLPPLEAMRHDCPVLSSDRSCLPEILGQAAIYFNPKDKKDITQKIGQVISDDGLRNRLIEKGREQVKNYSWERAAEQTIRLYNVF